MSANATVHFILQMSPFERRVALKVEMRSADGGIVLALTGAASNV